jgi:hypothetical protein
VNFTSAGRGTELANGANVRKENPRSSTFMKLNETEIPSAADSKNSTATPAARYVLGALAALALPAATTMAYADEAVAPPPPTRTHALVNFEFSDKYLTPRGMLVQNEGLVFQNLILGFFNLYGSDSFSATLVGGVWNCFGTSPLTDNNGDATSWYEIDPIVGFSFGLGQNVKLDITYTAFNMQIFNIPFSEHLETKLSFNDSALLGKFALNPYVILWTELDNKAVANTDANPQESFYFDVGIAPAFTCKDTGIKIEAPCRMLIAEADFYGTGAGSHSAVGLYELGVKASAPLKFMPDGYGSWSAHLGVKYMDFVDDNLIATQGRSDTWQIYGGITTFF